MLVALTLALIVSTARPIWGWVDSSELGYLLDPSVKSYGVHCIIGIQVLLWIVWGDWAAVPGVLWGLWLSHLAKQQALRDLEDTLENILKTLNK